MIDGKTLPRPHRGARQGRGHLRLPRGPRARRRALRRPLRGRAVERRAPALQRATSRAWAWTPRTRRSRGRPGRATTGSPASWTADTTGGLNRDGDVVLHVPAGHVASLIAKQRAGWLRARVTEPYEGQPPYSASPSVTRADRDHDRRHRGRGQRRARAGRGHRHLRRHPGQRFPLKRGPVVPGDERPGARGRRRTRAGTSGRRSPTSPSSGPDDKHLQRSTSPRARSAWGRPSGWPTGRCAATAPCRPRAPTCASASTASAAGRRGNVAPRAISVLKALDPVRDPRREPPAGPRRRGRRGHRERQDPRPHPAPRPRAAP